MQYRKTKENQLFSVITRLWYLNRDKTSKQWQKLENKTKENPKLEQNKLSDGRISLYLEYYLGREEKPVLDKNGNQVYYDSGKMQGKPKFAVKHNRRKENLSLYLIDKPRTPAERQQNKETLELATKIRAEREQEFKESMVGLIG